MMSIPHSNVEPALGSTRKRDEREAATITLFLLALEVDIAVLAARAAAPEPLEDDEA